MHKAHKRHPLCLLSLNTTFWVKRWKSIWFKKCFLKSLNVSWQRKYHQRLYSELLCSNVCEVRDNIMSSLSVFVSPPYIMSLQCHASQLWRPTIGSTLAKRYITCPYTLHGPMCINREPFRRAHTLWCDMNPPQRFDMIRLQTCRTGWARAALLNINLLSFSVLSFQLHVCTVWQDADNASDEPWGSGETEKRGTHLITGPHQMLEVFTHRAWNSVRGEMIYNVSLTAWWKQRRRDCTWENAQHKLNGFQTLIISHSVIVITWRQSSSDEENLAFSLGAGVGGNGPCWCFVCMSRHNHYCTLEETGTL